MDGLNALALTVTLVVGSNKRNKPIVNKDTSVAVAVLAVLAQDGRNLGAASRSTSREVHECEQTFFKLAHALYVRLDCFLALGITVNAEAQTQRRLCCDATQQLVVLLVKVVAGVLEKAVPSSCLCQLVNKLIKI